jgi:phosphomannomutase
MRKHLFFDLDKTITPARQPILPDMRELLEALPQDIVVVSGSLLKVIEDHTLGLPGYYLGVNGNHANNIQNVELWKHDPLSPEQKAEIHSHIEKMKALLEHELNEEWLPVEDRDAQITFSPIGNVAPVEVKYAYDPDRKKREWMLKEVPFESEDLIVKIGGSTSFDYFHKDRHKGSNVEKLIREQGWNKDECIYFGDGLFPGGNDEVVIGVIDTVLVQDHLDTYKKLREMFD